MPSWFKGVEEKLKIHEVSVRLNGEDRCAGDAREIFGPE